jgi:trk system potassium uptake protein TrkH
MRIDVVLRYVGVVLLLNSAFLVASAILAAAHGGAGFFPLLYSSIIALLFGVFPLIFVPAPTDITNMEGLVIVVASWVLSCLVGAIPYLLWGGEFTFTNAWFESVSGYTTTGSTILTDIEALSPGILFWRSATHWIGGIGIIVFVIAILPYLDFGESVLYRTETSYQMRERLRYRTKRAVQILVTVYVGLTVLQTTLLALTGMSLFDAVTHSFGTIATGGFSTRNASIAHYNNVRIEEVTILFMILAGMHFGLLFGILAGRWREFFKSSAVRFYVAALVAGVIMTTASLHGATYSGWRESLRFGAFQVVSVGTSTGFANADSSIWPALPQMLLLYFTLQCACAGSTSGGIKVDRIVLFLKSVGRSLLRLRYPSAVIPVRMDGEAVKEEVVGAGALYIVLYLAVVFTAGLLLAALGMDALSAFSGSAAAMGNVGPGLGTLGSMANYHHVPLAGKWILSATMLLGRLEIYGLLVFLLPRAWR